MTSPEPDLTWQPLYRIGGIAAMAFVVMVFIPLTLLVAAPVPPTDGRALLEYIATHRIVYLTQLVCFVGLAIPALVVFAAVAVALAGVSKGVAAIGGLFGVGSEVVALAVGSSPQSLHGGLVLLSDAYLAAGSDAERTGLVASAQALVAATNAMPWAGVLTALAILVLSLSARPVFGGTLAAVGLATGALGVLSEAFRPITGAGYLLYGLLLPLWFGWIGWKLLRLRQHHESPSPSPSS
ncbi:MAG: hypothetical protein WBP09_13335 [Propionicimonas sp.]